MFGSDGTSGINRRTLIVGGASALALGALARAGASKDVAAEEEETAAGDALDRPSLREKVQQYPYHWSATSPATHQGDTYTLVVQSTGTAAAKLWVWATIMDHRQRHHEPVVNEEFELAPAEVRELTAVNDYGTANHFVTRILTDAADVAALSLSVTVSDANGDETARFNERAFLIQSLEELRQRLEERRRHRRERRRQRPRRDRIFDSADHQMMEEKLPAKPALSLETFV